MTSPVTAGARTASGWRFVLLGALGGLAWAAGFRGFMAEVAGTRSVVDWVGTFEGILLPGAVSGMLLAWAEHLRRTGGRRHWRWLAAAPLVFVAATPGTLVSVVVDGGIGGGALGMPLAAMAGGFAISGRGPRWARAAAAPVALVPLIGWPLFAQLIDAGLAVTTPRGAFVATQFLSSLAVLILACAIPHRPVHSGPRL